MKLTYMKNKKWKKLQLIKLLAEKNSKLNIKRIGKKENILKFELEEDNAELRGKSEDIFYRNSSN